MSLPHDWFPVPLPRNVVIGERSWVYSSFAFLHYRSRRPVGLRVGNDTGVYYTTFFEIGPDGEVDIGDFCSIVGAIMNTNSRVEIHDYAFVAHDVYIGDQATAIPPDRGAEHARSRPIVIGDNAWIGAKAIILGGVTIGDNAIVGAGAVVTSDVPAYAIAAGNPCRVVGSCRT
jgi:acetyltransferase-like isoleucine patch superfamily enzyme